MLMMMHSAFAHPGMSATHREIAHHGVSHIPQPTIQVPYNPQTTIRVYTLCDDPKPDDEWKTNEGEGSKE
jgi:hypothetical protein